MAKHTQTPWTAYNQQVRDTSEHMVSIAYCSVVAGAGVCRDGKIRSFGIDEETAKSNAAFIVKAVNNHADAISLLEAASTSLWRSGENGLAREIDRFLDRVGGAGK